MLTKLDYTLSSEHLQEALYAIFYPGFEEVLNEPTGTFFYDPWKLKNQYRGTIWQTVLESLPHDIGEAKIRKLDSGQAYICHADIDDRYHLNISGDHSYLVDLDREILHPTLADGVWYSMDAGWKHSAVNFGNRVRFQLVVRQLLKQNTLADPETVTIVPVIADHNEARYIFDSIISPWLNMANKNKWINNFSYSDIIKFDIDKKHLSEIKNLLPTEFKLL
jgi:hypothetical protein